MSSSGPLASRIFDRLGAWVWKGGGAVLVWWKAGVELRVSTWVGGARLFCSDVVSMLDRQTSWRPGGSGCLGLWTEQTNQATGREGRRHPDGTLYRSRVRKRPECQRCQAPAGRPVSVPIIWKRVRFPVMVESLLAVAPFSSVPVLAVCCFSHARFRPLRILRTRHTNRRLSKFSRGRGGVSVLGLARSVWVAGQRGSWRVSARVAAGHNF